MKREEIERRVVQVISDQVGYVPDYIKPEQSLSSDLGCDSLDEIEIVMELENEFCVEIPDSDLTNIKTVQQAFDLIAKYVRGLQ